MRFLFIGATVLLFSLPTAFVSAATFTVETQTGGSVTTSRVTVDTPRGSAKSVSEKITELYIAMGGDNTLDILNSEVTIIARDVVNIVGAQPVDLSALQEVTERLTALALRVRVYLLQEQLADLQKVYTTSNSEIVDIVFGE